MHEVERPLIAGVSMPDQSAMTDDVFFNSENRSLARLLGVCLRTPVHVSVERSTLSARRASAESERFVASVTQRETDRRCRCSSR